MDGKEIAKQIQLYLYEKDDEWDKFELEKIIPMIDAAIAQAVAQEREACALLCDNLEVDDERCKELLLTEQAWSEAMEVCAKAIRARTTT